MPQKNSMITAKYGLVQGLYWMSIAVALSFSSVYLLSKDFTNTQIGITVGIASFIAAILQPVVAGFADYTDKVSLNKIVSILSIAMLVFGGLLFIVKSKMIIIALLYGMIMIFLLVILPLVSSLGMEYINRGVKLNFGLARGMGSLSYAIISYCVGILVALYGTVVIPILIILVNLVFIFAVYNFRDSKTVTAEKKLELERRLLERELEENQKAEGHFFSRYPKFSILLVGIVIACLSQNMMNNFLFQIVENKGGGSTEFGITMALAALCELPTMLLFVYMVDKVRCDIWMKISSIFFLLKSFATFFVSDIYGIYMIQILQMMGFALFTLSSIFYVNRVMRHQDRIKGQAFMTMTGTLGGVLGSLFGGIIIDNSGVPAMLVLSIVTAGIGMIIMWFSTEKI